MFNTYHNKTAFLNKKPKKLFLFVLVFITFLILFLIFSIKLECYDHYRTKGYVDCEESCVIITAIPSNIEYQKIKLNNKKWNPTLLDKKLEIDEEQMISYYKLTLSSREKRMNKEIVDLNFYYNKQRIIKKIGNLMF